MDLFQICTNIEIKNTKKGKGVFTKTPFKKGDTVLKFERPIWRSNKLAKITAIQVDDDSYLDTEPIEVRDFLNHGCDPNCKINFKELKLVAIKKINSGEELTFHYCTTEFDLFAKKESFKCLCGSDKCLGIVKGFYHLTKEQKIKLRESLAPYLLKKYNEMA